VLLTRRSEQGAGRATVQRVRIPWSARELGRVKARTFTLDQRTEPGNGVREHGGMLGAALTGSRTVAYRPRVPADRLLVDRVALITGAASGQGRAAAELFAAHGAAIVVADLDDDGVFETVARVEKEGGAASAVHADVSRPDDCDAIVKMALDEYGRIDVLYNNAAIQMSGTLVETTEAMWDITIATNLTAIFRTCRAALPHMLEAGRGSIINTSSTLGQQGSQGYAAYGAAKAGLIALTRQIAVEYGPEVRANVIAPGSSA